MRPAVPTSTRVMALALAVAMVLLSLLPWFVRGERSRQALYAEEAGVFEEVSALLWLVLAAALFVILRPTTWRVAAAAVVCLFAAAREADWHKSFTGYSVLKIGYYFDGAYPLTQRLLIALLVAAGVISLGVTGLTLFRHFQQDGGLRVAWSQHFLIFLGIAALTKVLDRTPAIAEDWLGVTAIDLFRHMMQACEEGLEMLLPVLLAVAAVVFARSHAGKWQRNEPAAAH